ncbi:MAG: leucine-rich repeat domain-containing protein, partial [Streptococcaceae bacterium]|nr:leucine-rich repeat domain-containing protein [Streptococcaceae bacterium]
MKKILFLLFGTLVFTIQFFIVPPHASATVYSGEGYTYDTVSKTLTVTSEAGCLNWKTNPYDFSQEMRTLVLEEGIVNIPPYAFENNLLANVEFPQSLEVIGRYAFLRSYGLTELDFRHTNLRLLDTGSFRYAHSLFKVFFPLEDTGFHFGDICFQYTENMHELYFYTFEAPTFGDGSFDQSDFGTSTHFVYFPNYSHNYNYNYFLWGVGGGGWYSDYEWCFLNYTFVPVPFSLLSKKNTLDFGTFTYGDDLSEISDQFSLINSSTSSTNAITLEFSASDAIFTVSPPTISSLPANVGTQGLIVKPKPDISAGVHTTEIVAKTKNKANKNFELSMPASITITIATPAVD